MAEVALVYIAIIAGVIVFQFCLMAGAPWGRLTQGGQVEGVHGGWNCLGGEAASTLGGVDGLGSPGRAGSQHDSELDHPIPGREAVVGAGYSGDARTGRLCRTCWSSVEQRWPTNRRI